jgi:Flp pilus assembly protein TadD
VQVGDQGWADRYSYVPSIGLFVAFTWFVSDVAPSSFRRFGLPGAAVAVLLAAGLLTRVQAGYWKDSETVFRHSLKVSPQSAIVRSFLGGALTEKGDLDEGIVQLQEALRLRPDFAEAHGKLALALETTGKSAEAIGEYRTALKLKPDLVEALNNLAWLLATDPEATLRNGVEAVDYAERACRLTRFQKTTCIGTLAAAYAEAGRFPDAIATAEKAIALARAQNERGLADANETLLGLYRQGQPFRQPARAP